MSNETFDFYRVIANYCFLILEPIFLFILIYRRKNIPNPVFYALLIFSIFWICDTLMILTHAQYLSKKVNRTLILILVLYEFFAPFAIYYFYIVPEKWKRNLRLLFILYILLIIPRITYNMLILKTFSSYQLDPIGYFFITPIALISFFKITPKDEKYTFYFSPRFYLNCAYTFHFVANSTVFLFRYNLFYIDQKLLNILLSIHLLTWFVTLYFHFRAVLTFDAKKEELISNRWHLLNTDIYNGTSTSFFGCWSWLFSFKLLEREKLSIHFSIISFC